jgi:hypothetical protein
MADVYSVAVGATTVGANARIVKANYAFGTPNLKFYKVAATAANGSTPVDFSAETANSNFYKALNALQGFAEIYWADGGTAGFVVAVNNNTTNSGSNATPSLSDGSFGAAEAAIVAALAAGGSSTATVTEIDLASNGLSID